MRDLMYLKIILLSCGLFLLVGCASLPQVELDIARTEVAKAYATGAKVLSPEEYEAASSSLHNAEMLVYQGRYARARVVLNQALLHAAKATEQAKKRAAELEARRRAEALARKAAERRARREARKKTEPAKEKPAPPKEKPALPDQVTVAEGETLFSLAGRKDIYGDSLLWPLIYKANRDQIKDPAQIYKGQIFTIPRDKSNQEEEAARREAVESGLFRTQ